MRWLHHRYIAHCDISMENILVTKDLWAVHGGCDAATETAGGSGVGVPEAMAMPGSDQWWNSEKVQAMRLTYHQCPRRKSLGSGQFSC